MDNKPSPVHERTQSNTPEPTPAPLVPKKNLPLLLGIGILVVIGILAGLLIMSAQKNTAVVQQGPTPTPTIALQNKYSNPFDKKSQYENPFNSKETYTNPFDTSK